MNRVRAKDRPDARPSDDGVSRFDTSRSENEADGSEAVVADAPTTAREDLDIFSELAVIVDGSEAVIADGSEAVIADGWLSPEPFWDSGFFARYGVTRAKISRVAIMGHLR